MTCLAALATLLLLAAPLAGAYAVARGQCGDPRLALGWAALAWSAWAVLVSELLSLGAPHVVGDDPGWLTRWPLVTAWALPAIGGAWVLGRRRAAALRGTGADAWSALRGAPDESRWVRAGRWAVATCLAVTFAVAVIAAPNNWDSMVYHLARVETWARLGGVVHYATNVEPQLYQPPGAELLIAQGYVIAGSALLAALVQWMAYVGVVALSGAAAQALGASRAMQVAASVLAAMSPLAILEASSTQNDLVLAFWLLLAATFAVQVWTAAVDRSPRWHAATVLGASAAIGLAVLTKGTGLMFGAPVGALLAVATARRFGPARTTALAAAGVALVVLPNAGQWVRNEQTFGTPVATGSGPNSYRVADPSARTLAANLLRNATNHLDLPGSWWNDQVEDATRATLEAIGADADDPRTTFLGKPFRVGPFGPHEDHAGSLLLLVLGLWAAGATVVARVRGRAGSGVQLAWLGMLAGQVVLFCLLVTWQNWHVRMHLPVTVALVPFVVAALARVARGRVVVTAAVLATCAAPLYLAFNVTRPLVGGSSILTHSRTHTQFVPRPQLEAPYREVVQWLSHARVEDAGLLTEVDDWQYPLSALGREASPRVRFREVLTDEPSRRYERRSTGIADAVVCVSCHDYQRAALRAAGLEPVELSAGGPRRGRGDDVTTVELWAHPTRPGRRP